MRTTTEVSNSLERVDGIINMLDEICDHMDGFSSAEEAWLSSITETLRTWGYVMQETYEGPEESKDDWQLRETWAARWSGVFSRHPPPFFIFPIA